MKRITAQQFADKYLGAHGGDEKACDEAIKWLKRYHTKNGVCDLAAAWDACQRGDWLDWVVGEIGNGHDCSQVRRAMRATDEKHNLKDWCRSDANEIRKRIPNPWR